MIVEEPKNGAINRAAAISAPSVASPTAKTSASSGGSAWNHRSIVDASGSWAPSMVDRPGILRVTP